MKITVTRRITNSSTGSRSTLPVIRSVRQKNIYKNDKIEERGG